MKRLRTFLSLLLILIYAGAFNVFAAAVPKPVLKANDSVVRILTSYSDGTMASGSGFVVSGDKANTFIVTNHHVAVLDNPTYISVILNSEAEINASVVASDEDRDLAVIKVAMPLGLDPLKLSRESAKKGDGIYVIGFPGDADIFTENLALNHEDTTITDGILSALRSVSITSTGDPVALIQVSAAINHGNSGGPVLDMNGRVVGVSTFTMGATSTDINGAVSVTELISFLQENGISFTLDSGVFKVNPVLIGSIIAVLAVIAVGTIILSRRKKKASEVLEPEIGNPVIPGTEYQTGLETSWSVQPASPGSLRKSQKEKKPRSLKRIIPTAIGICVIILIVGGFLEYGRLQQAIEAGNVNNLNPFFLQIAGMTDGQVTAYVDAMKLLNSGDYDGAKHDFSALSGYRDSDKMVLECQYQKGKRLIADKRFEEAKTIFTELGDYSDSTEMIKEADYQRGLVEIDSGNYNEAYKIYKELASDPCYKDSDIMMNEVTYQHTVFIYESGQYGSAYRAMKELADEGYQKAINDLPTVAETAYGDAVNEYRIANNAADYGILASTFKILGDYEDSETYKRLSEIKYEADNNSFLLEHHIGNAPVKISDDIEFLLQNISFEDAAQLVLYNTAYADTFLSGTWRSADGYYYFKMGNGGTQYNLPEVKSGTYHFDMGTYIVTANGNEYNQFLFSVIDRNTIDVLCYADRYTYTLYRN